MAHFLENGPTLVPVMVLKMSWFDGRTLTLVVQMTPPSKIATDAVHLPETLCCGQYQLLRHT